MCPQPFTLGLTMRQGGIGDIVATWAASKVRFSNHNTVPNKMLHLFDQKFVNSKWTQSPIRAEPTKYLGIPTQFIDV